ncbi:MAG: ABC transporter substrate-binding protein [Natronomonas sp.]|uniref:ABC transporter substrate-binding protein n=1 Tax=Natronomonas sp. TaxID=2184060 RepID=UPI0028703B6C|nr:ABC transporter substrate-binding protein [Natronomonas sp.]MDR9429394.1 ABC transporter substrate-binding protein [Natronomonas sp.]
MGVGGAATLAGCFGGGGNENGNGGADVDIPDEYVEDDPAGDPVEPLVYENLNADFSARFYYGEVHANILRDIGFEVEYNVRELQAHLDETFTARNHDLMNLRWLDGFDPDRPLRDGAGETNLAPGGGNVANHWNPEYQELLSQQAAAVDDDERQDIVFQCQKYLVEEEFVLLPIMVQGRAMPYNAERVSNVEPFLENGLAATPNMVNVETPDGELITSSQESLTTLDPMSAQRGRVDRDHVRLIFDRLAWPDPDEGYLPTPWAADSIEFTDNTTLEVTLREGLEFHDGEPVTAEDIEFTFTYGADQNPGLAGVLTNLDEVVPETDLDVTFNLSSPDATFLSRAIAGRNSGILPMHILEGVDDPSGWDQPGSDLEFIGSGPFQFSDWQVGEQLILEAHDAHQHAPNIDRLVRLQASDSSSAAAAVESKEADMVPYNLPPDQLDRLRGLDHIELLESLMTSIHYGTFNMDPGGDNPFKYRELREGVAHTYDRENWLDVGAGGYGEVITTTFTPGLDFWYGSKDEVSPFPFDPDAAIETLGEYGFRWNSDGRIHYPENPGENLTTLEDSYWGDAELPDVYGDWR